MLYWIIPSSVLLFAVIFTLTVMYICFLRIFHAPRKRPRTAAEIPLPQGKMYEPHHEQIKKWVRELRETEHTDVCITSFDGLRLCGKYYEQKKGAPIEIMFHGYKGSAERDMCGGMYRCFSIGHNALIVDQRAHGGSEGKVITFGVKEYRDCLSWIDFVIKNIDKDAQIIITGISMGAATVMNAASAQLPQNVVGALADCGYTSAKDVIKKVMTDMGLPANLLYPFARLGAIVFGGFDPDEISPISSMKKCKIPVIFFHGDRDDFVPCSMSRENFNACASERKKFVIIHGAGHGLCFPTDKELYFKELNSFFGDN